MRYDAAAARDRRFIKCLALGEQMDHWIYSVWRHYGYEQAGQVLGLSTDEIRFIVLDRGRSKPAGGRS